MADANVQPVPWVWRVAIRSTSKRTSSSRVTRRSTSRSPSRCPPFISTALAPMASRSCAAARMSASLSTLRPVSAAASGALGVRRVARGIRTSRSAASAVSASRGCPPLAIMTGSMTAGSLASLSQAATARTTSASPSMPVLTTSTPMSPCTARAWAITISPGMAWTPVTPNVFCTVIAVTAVAA